MHLTRLIPVGVALSVVILVLISVGTGVSWTDITAVGLRTFALAAGAALVRLGLQGLRFHVYVRGTLPTALLPASTSVRVRAGSEFVALATLPYIGDELVRIAWLRRRGVSTGGAAWLAYTELFSDVVVTSILALVAAVYALALGGFGVGILVAVLVAPILTVHLLVVVWAARGKVFQPLALFALVSRVLGPTRGNRIAQSIADTLTQFSGTSRTFFTRTNVAAVVAGFALTAGIATLPGLALWLTFTAFGVRLTLWDTILVSHASGALANLPITLGGSGLGELGANLYTSTVYGVTHWPGVVTWRIATFHVPLIATGLALVSVVTPRGRRQPAIRQVAQATG